MQQFFFLFFYIETNLGWEEKSKIRGQMWKIRANYMILKVKAKVEF